MRDFIKSFYKKFYQKINYEVHKSLLLNGKILASINNQKVQINSLDEVEFQFFHKEVKTELSSWRHRELRFLHQ